METNLLSSIKYRLFDEIRGAIQKNLVYKDKVECYHKFPQKEQPPMGVFLRNISSSRVKLSPDDFSATLKSHFTMAQVASVTGMQGVTGVQGAQLIAKPGRFINWVWEDTTQVVKHAEDEDLSSQLLGTTGTSGDTGLFSSFGTNRLFVLGWTGAFGVSGAPGIPESPRTIVAGPNNTDIADNFRQVDLTLNGAVVHAELVDGNRGWVMLPVAPPPGSSLTASYYYSNLAAPGRYYIEIVSPTEFVVDPLYTVTKEKVIERTTGTESSCALDNPIGSSQLFDLVYLYTIQGRSEYREDLVRDSDYTIDTAGVITLLHVLPVGVTLYADYRWQGNTLGPFPIPSVYHYNNTAIPGAILAFSNEIVVGDRLVVLVFPEREIAASVYSGHFNITVDIDVFARDPIQLPDLTDHILTEIWNNRRLELMNEGITITEFDPTGESEEPYDRNTGDLYYHNSLNMQVMTEWKKFVPYVTEIKEFNILLYAFVNTSDVQYVKTFNFSDALYATTDLLVAAINEERLPGYASRFFFATLKNSVSSVDLLSKTGSITENDTTFFRTVLPTDVFTLKSLSVLGSGITVNSVTYDIPASRDRLTIRASIRYDNETIPPSSRYSVTDQGKILITKLLPWNKTFEVKYPKTGYARYL